MSFDKIIDKYNSCEFAGFYNAVSSQHCNILLVREMTGGIYHGERGRLFSPCGGCLGRGCQEVYDTEKYSGVQIERILNVAYECSDLRQKKLCIVDKADVLESSMFWREIAEETAANFPQIETAFLYIEKAVTQIIRNPDQFDVIVTSNMFGEILGGVLAALPNTTIQQSSNLLASNVSTSTPPKLSPPR